VPPRTVANSDKENIRVTQTTTAESSNPALTPTASPRTDQPRPLARQPPPINPKTPSTGASEKLTIEFLLASHPRFLFKPDVFNFLHDSFNIHRSGVDFHVTRELCINSEQARFV
jgi:hypothetical protein